MSGGFASGGFTIEVFTRGNDPVPLPAGVEFAPQSWDASAVGGPVSASVLATGGEEALGELADWLGCSLWIVSPDGEYVWYGDIAEVLFDVGGESLGVTLERVANRIKVAYTDDTPGGDLAAAETTWAENTASIGRFGLRERIITAQGSMWAVQAEKMRDTMLNKVATPSPLTGRVGPSTGVAQATLVCRGWWLRMEDVYYAQDNGLLEYTDGSLAHPLGLGFTGTLTAAVNVDGKFSLHEVDGKMEGFAVPGLQLLVAGMANGGNNKAYTVESGDAKEVKTLTASNIAFDPADDIRENPYAYQLVNFAAGDVILVSGAASGANNGSHLVKSPSSTHIEVSPSWSNSIVAGAAGPSVTIKRGNSIAVKESTVNERTGANATVMAYGQGIAQRFQTGTSGTWGAATVELKVRKVGNPTDDIEIRLVTDSGGSFGTWVATALIDDADVSGDEQGRWVSASFDIQYSLAPGTWYWLGIQRVGSAHPTNYYQVWLDEDAGFPGTLLLSDGTSYQVPTEAKSLCFRLLGAVDTARQVEAICNTVDAFDAVVVSSESGVKTCQFRGGELYAAVEAGELLDTGDGSNVRLIATVNALRLVTIRTLPTRSSALYLWREGTLYTAQGRAVAAGALPVGEWCHLDRVSLLRGALADASPFFVEKASYSPGGGWRLEGPGEVDPWEAGVTLDG